MNSDSSGYDLGFLKYLLSPIGPEVQYNRLDLRYVFIFIIGENLL